MLKRPRHRGGAVCTRCRGGEADDPHQLGFAQRIIEDVRAVCDVREPLSVHGFDLPGLVVAPAKGVSGPPAGQGRGYLRDVVDTHLSVV
jgi:hypothetical protein